MDPPISAVLPSRDNATPAPNDGVASPPVPRGPPQIWAPGTQLPDRISCRVQTPPVRWYTTAAPLPARAPTSAVSPSPDNAAPTPNPSSKPRVPASPGGAGSIGPCWLQPPPVRVNTQDAAAANPVIHAVLPSSDNATLVPKAEIGGPPVPFGPLQSTVQVPISFGPCWLQVPPSRVNTHTAPAPLLSANAPISAVLPSADNATSNPKRASPTVPVPLGPPQLLVQLPTSFAPCWVQTSADLVNTQAVPGWTPAVRGAPISAVVPSAERSTL